MFTFPLLIGDIGGTTSRFALLSGQGAPPSRLSVMATARHTTPSDAIRAALAALRGEAPRAAFLGVAGRVDGPVVRLTNAPWVVNAAQIGMDLGLSAVSLVNDYVPVAALLPALDRESTGALVHVGPSLPPVQGNRIAMGPGTGLGASACIPVQERSWLQPTEAGHMSFGACDSEELAIWPRIERAGARIAVETVLSGPGLVRLYRAVARREGSEQLHLLTPAEVIAAASSERDEIASEALGLFFSLLGRFAGDMALAFNASGGVYLASGILPRIVGLLDKSRFRQAFERKDPFESAMARIPTFVVTQPEPAMAGLALIAGAPDRFVFQTYGWSAAGAS